MVKIEPKTVKWVTTTEEDIIKHISPKLASWGVRGKITIPWIL